ncbi:flagellin [Ectothiorhodospira mobilis]|uniref:flagellin n=1 Tax=Ectothiorhodospira mobilis TaxID=195064 RepID=UPI0019052323|nr:flagellin [Ectothiorhodospira mobilis]MBK1693067.1 flagellin [Ectothiorhodospira mobilis]
MSQVINTNIASLNAQRNLNSSQADLQTALQRLSSGLRINSAKDDAAGLAISERFTTQIRGQNQAIRNAGDGISYAQTAEGALGEVGNLLQRIRELAVQSANATNSNTDREALNKEVQQAIAEINRIASNTQFNDDNILDGSVKELIFQVGANAGQTIVVGGVDARGSELGAFIESTTDLLTAASGGAGTTLEDQFAANDTVNFGTITISSGGATVGTIGTFDATSLEDVVSAINSESANTGVRANLSEDGEEIVFSSALAQEDGDAGFTAGAGFTVTWGDIGADDGSGFTVTANDANDSIKTLNDLAVDTVANANDTMVTVDYALQQINGFRAELGAIQNRFESNISNLEVGVENLSASRSRILDADFAKETAALTRAQILQQAGTSVLAQANQTPNNVLSLLQ